MQLLNEENMFERILSTLFPVVLGSVDLEHTAEYHERISRRGVDNRPGDAYGRIAGPAQFKQVFHLPGRTV